METAERLRLELQSFENTWRGGYYEGNPLDPLAPSGYGEFGYMSVLHAVFLICIKPYVTDKTTVLEIGPGRGAWTKTMLHAKEIWCLDAKSRQDNGIDAYLGHPTNLKYIKVNDFSCKELPEETFDFLFSFGALCHVSWDGVVQYAQNLYPKLRSGAHGFWMIADYEKLNRLGRDLWRFDVISRIHASKRMRYLEAIDRRLGRAMGRRSFMLEAIGDAKRDRILRVLGLRLWPRKYHPYMDQQEDMYPRPFRWYHTGINRMADKLNEVGYDVLDKDIGVVHRDPIIHFMKP